MSRFRLISSCLLAAFALGAVVLASAGAEEPRKCGVENPTHWVFCYSNHEEIGKPVQDVTGEGGVATLVAKMSGEARVECEKSSLTGELEPEGKGGGTLALSKCKMTKPAGCKLTEVEGKEIKLRFAVELTGKLSAGDAGATFSGTGSGEEVYILFIEHENSECAITAGGYKVSGKQSAELPSAESALVEHEIVAKKSGSSFKIGEDSATLSDTVKVKLSSPHEGETWYVGLGT